jgi:hypothetical protein
MTAPNKEDPSMATSKKATAKPTTPAPATSKAPVKAATKPAPKKASPAKAPAGKGVKTSVKKAATQKPAAKPQASAKPVKAAKTAKPEKIKKPKLVRDSFTIPKTEYVVLDGLKQRAAKLTRPAKKSELLRAGIKLLAGLSDAAFLTALEQVPAIKTGRPSGA